MCVKKDLKKYKLKLKREVETLGLYWFTQIKLRSIFLHKL